MMRDPNIGLDRCVRAGLGLALVAAVSGLVACGGGGAKWEVAKEDLDSGLTTITGTSSTDIWVAGGDTGGGPLVMHYDGTDWNQVDTGATGDLWWVFALPGGDRFFGGAGGLILRHDGSSFETMDTPGDGTVFGIWGTAGDDLFAVGGSGNRNGFVWHYDGSQWTSMELPAEMQDVAVFKVWGNGADDVWFVGGAGSILHYDGSDLTLVESPTQQVLFTVHGSGDNFAAVGGAATGVILELDPDSGTWNDVSPDLAPRINGVHLKGDDGYAVGNDGAIYRKTSKGWEDEKVEFFVQALHAVWIDDTGGVWAVGGQVLAEPLSGGVIWHKGN